MYKRQGQLGVEFIIPDFSYLIENKERIQGIFITHAHDDVVAALPYLLKQVNAPVYTGALTANIIHEMLKKEGIKNAKIHRLKRCSKQTIGGVKIRDVYKRQAFDYYASVNQISLIIKSESDDEESNTSMK